LLQVEVSLAQEWPERMSLGFELVYNGAQDAAVVEAEEIA